MRGQGKVVQFQRSQREAGQVWTFTKVVRDFEGRSLDRDAERGMAG